MIFFFLGNISGKEERSRGAKKLRKCSRQSKNLDRGNHQRWWFQRGKKMVDDEDDFDLTLFNG